jgi:hypothetical protein
MSIYWIPQDDIVGSSQKRDRSIKGDYSIAIWERQLSDFPLVHQNIDALAGDPAAFHFQFRVYRACGIGLQVSNTA